MEIITLRTFSPLCASAWIAIPALPAGNTSIHFGIHSKDPLQLPVESLKIFASAKSHIIGIAWREKVCSIFSPTRFQTHSVERRFASRSTAKDKNVAIAWPYSSVPPSEITLDWASATKSPSVVRAVSCRLENSSA